MSDKKVVGLNGEPIDVGITSAEMLEKAKECNFPGVLCIGVTDDGLAILTNNDDAHAMLATLEIAKAMVIGQILSVEPQ